MHASSNQNRLGASLVLFTLFVFSTVAEELDPGKLPPPATVAVEFERDIKPIFAQSCFRCHGPEKPKSDFRLDNRDSALKGGNSFSDDILPGDSARSRLVHFTARLVTDMEMPPEGKGEPLTTNQVALLRAWIDQGASWGASNVTSETELTLATAAGWMGVSGDRNKFRELEGIREGWSGGIEQFSMREQLGLNRKFSVEGRVLFDQRDARLRLTYEKTGFGFVRVGVEQWPRYYDDTGGYYRPALIPSFNLDRNLHLDHDRAWIDFGLTLPHWPQLVLGYEYQSKDGTESTLQWGLVGGERSYYPSPKTINEDTHIVKLDVTHDWRGWHIEDSARLEFYDLKSSRDNATAVSLGPLPDTLERAQERNRHVQGVNTVTFEREIRGWWLLSGGYLFSKFNGDARLNQTTLDSSYLPVPGKFWNTDDITLRRDAHVFSVANLFTPAEKLSVTVAVQSDWTHQEGFGVVRLDEGDPYAPGPDFLAPATADSNLDKQKTMENAGLRFTGIARTVLFAEARFEQERIGHFEKLEGDVHEQFLRDTDATNDRLDWRAGFNASPWNWFSFTAHYRGRNSDSDYDHNDDFSLESDGDGYSAFITAREIRGNEILAKVVLRPRTWLKTTFTCEREISDFDTTTDPIGGITPGARHHAGEYEADIYSANVTLTPFQRVYFSGALSYGDTRTIAARNENPSVTDYRGHTWSALGSVNAILNARTDFQVVYSFSCADFAQDNFADGLPLGIDFTRHSLVAGVSRKLSERVTTGLRYAFYRYDEPTSGGGNDYTAHGVFATLTLKWP
jgi:hypothetical protein